VKRATTIGFIHRDVAARNVLLGGADGSVTMIADFGLSRTDAGVDENVTRTRVGPLKWMAPEQLERLSYSTASDVFAFGVLSYEVFARQEPWPKLSNTAACHRVLSGERVPTPNDAPDGIGALMTLCMQTEAGERPSMDDVVRKLDGIRDRDDDAARDASLDDETGYGPAPAVARLCKIDCVCILFC
jgi:serine/threonine protein kinase